MWAQLVKARVKVGREEELRRLYQEASSTSSPDSGWVRSLSLRNQNDPQEIYGVIIFESEARAREYERSSEQAELTGHLGDLMDGTPEFVDFDSVEEYAPGR